MVFNNPEFTEFNENIDKQTTSSMDDDDIYDWSRKSLTPSNKLGQMQPFAKMNSATPNQGRFSSRFVQNGSHNSGNNHPKRESLGDEIITPKAKGAGSNPAQNDGGFGKFIQTQHQGRRSAGRAYVYTPENKPRTLDKRAKFVKAQSMLGFLNEIEEVEEDDKPKYQTPVIYPGLQTFDPTVHE